MSTIYTVISGFFSNNSLLDRKEFTDRKAAWDYVKSLMPETINQAGDIRHHCVLQVYTERPDGTRTVTDFKRYIPGSKYCRWGDWGCTTSSMSGALCG